MIKDMTVGQALELIHKLTFLGLMVYCLIIDKNIAALICYMMSTNESILINMKESKKDD